MRRNLYVKSALAYNLPMNPADLRELLEQVRASKLSIDAALQQLHPAEADLGFAHVDLQRRDRCGFPEVIFCEGKTSEWIEAVAAKLTEAGQDCLATRVNAEQAAYLAERFPQAKQDRLARTFWLPVREQTPRLGRVAVITAGTSDLPVAREAFVTAEALGCNVTLLADVGVAGIHRLLRHREHFADADAIVVAAGMDGRCPASWAAWSIARWWRCRPASATGRHSAGWRRS